MGSFDFALIRAWGWARCCWAKDTQPHPTSLLGLGVLGGGEDLPKPPAIQRPRFRGLGSMGGISYERP